MKLLKKAVLLMLTTVLCLTVLTGCGEKEEKTFTVGFDAGFPPMGYTADDGSYVGFDLDLAAEVAERNGWKLKLQPIIWSAKDSELESGTIDCVWNGFTKSPERLDKYTWTDAYMNNNQIIVVKADSPYQTVQDLKGKTVGVQEDSSALTAISGNEEFKAIYGKLIETENNLLALQDLDAGGVDAVVMDECVALYNIEKKGANYRVLDYVVGKEEFAIGFKLGNETLRDQVQETLLEMVEDGKMAEISKEWFDKDITTLGK